MFWFFLCVCGDVVVFGGVFVSSSYHDSYVGAEGILSSATTYMGGGGGAICVVLTDQVNGKS